jgi:hypothetical protein
MAGTLSVATTAVSSAKVDVVDSSEVCSVQQVYTHTWCYIPEYYTFYKYLKS